MKKIEVLNSRKRGHNGADYAFFTQTAAGAFVVV